MGPNRFANHRSIRHGWVVRLNNDLKNHSATQPFLRVLRASVVKRFSNRFPCEIRTRYWYYSPFPLGAVNERNSESDGDDYSAA